MKITKIAGRGERRFRTAIVFDVFVPETEDMEADRGIARAKAEEARMNSGIVESFIGNILSDSEISYKQL